MSVKYSDVFKVIENLFNEKIPACVVNVLRESGFDTEAAIKELDDNRIEEIENFINEDTNTFNKIQEICPSYTNQERFRLLPGHKIIIKAIREKLDSLHSVNENKHITSELPYVLKILVDSFLVNVDRVPKRHRYEEALRYLSIYIYTMCGKSCYETLSANLPLPQPSTISK